MALESSVQKLKEEITKKDDIIRSLTVQVHTNNLQKQNIASLGNIRHTITPIYWFILPSYSYSPRYSLHLRKRINKYIRILGLIKILQRCRAAKICSTPTSSTPNSTTISGANYRATCPRRSSKKYLFLNPKLVSGIESIARYKVENIPCSL